MRRGAAQDLERECEQRVARQYRRRLIESPMHGGTAAAQVVIVHRRQVIMDEGVAMHAFNGGTRLQRAGFIHAKEASALGDEKGPDPLAGRQQRIAHRLHKARGGARCHWQEMVETSLDLAGKNLEMPFEIQE